MSEVKGRSKARALAGVLVAFLAVLGLPAQAAFAAASPGLDTAPEVTDVAAGGTFTLSSTVSGTGGAAVSVNFEIVELGETGAPDVTCTVPAGDDDCSATLSTAGIAAGQITVVSWAQNPGPPCNSDRLVCGSASNEQPGDADTDNTDVVLVNQLSSESVTLDCTPDSQNVPIGASTTITCTQKDNNGTPTPVFEVDMEQRGGPGDGDVGQFSPVDGDAVDGGASPFTVAAGPSATSGVAYYCFWLDTNSATSDLGAEGPSAADGGDCAAEQAALEDTDTSEVVCVSFGDGACAGVVPPPPDGDTDPVITGPVGCVADGEDDVAFGVTSLFGFRIPFAVPTTFGVSAGDADGGLVTLALGAGAPAWIALSSPATGGNPVLGTITGTPDVTDWLGGIFGGGVNPTFTVVATDDEGDKDSCKFTAHVTLLGITT